MSNDTLSNSSIEFLKLFRNLLDSYMEKMRLGRRINPDPESNPIYTYNIFFLRIAAIINAELSERVYSEFQNIMTLFCRYKRPSSLTDEEKDILKSFERGEWKSIENVGKRMWDFIKEVPNHLKEQGEDII